MSRSGRVHLYSFAADLIDVSMAAIQGAFKVDQEAAHPVAVAIAREVCFRNAKSTVYIPEAANLANMKRNDLIWAGYQVDGPPPGRARKFSPDRVVELANEFNMSTQYVYRIIKAARKSAAEGMGQGRLEAPDSFVQAFSFLLLEPGAWFTVEDLARRSGASGNSLSSRFSVLVKAGIVLEKWVGARRELGLHAEWDSHPWGSELRQRAAALGLLSVAT